MTTNSPNPVDGDVQALIARCQKHLQWLKDNAASYPDNVESLEEDRLIHEAALAALTAEPEYNVSFEGGEIRLDVTKAEYNGRHPDYRWISYTTPPAQLSRPVEKPTTKCIGWVKESIQEHDEKWISAIREAGYEVKS